MPTRHPVALFAHRRADLLAGALDALRRAGVPRIRAYVDGSRGPQDDAGRAAVLTLLRGIDWAEVSVTERVTNLGADAALRAGLGDFFAAEPAGIVIEEDVRLADGAYGWMCESLDRYAADTRVAAVSAWAHRRFIPEGTDAPWWSMRWSGWGWGAWRRTWQLMAEPADALLARLAAEGFDAAAYGDDIPTLIRLEQWDAHFALACFGARQLTLYPPRSLADHDGLGGDATHHGHAAQWRAVPAAPLTARWPWPDDVREAADSAALWRVAAAAADDPPRGSAMTRLRHKLGRVRRAVTRGWRRWPDALLLRAAVTLLRWRGRPAFDEAIPAGLPVERHLWRQFVARHRDAFFGAAMELGNDATIREFGGESVRSRQVFDLRAGAGVDRVVDLLDATTVPEVVADVIVIPFTMHLLADDRTALANALRMLRPEGSLLLPFPAVSQVGPSGFTYGDRTVHVMRGYTIPGLQALFASLGIPASHVTLEPLGGPTAIGAALFGIPVESIGARRVEEVAVEAPLLIGARITRPVAT